MQSVELVQRFNRVLVVVAPLALLVALFAPDAATWGVDFGPAAVVVYSTCIWLLVWQVGWHPERVFPADWSIAERRGWAAVFFGSLILMSFVHFLVHVSHGDVVPNAPWKMMSRQFFWNLGLLLVAWAVVQRSLGARNSGAVELDERDLRIRHAAVRFGDTLLCVTVVVCVVLLASVPGERLSWWLAPLITAHLLIGVLIFKSLAENLWLVVSYARERD